MRFKLSARSSPKRRHEYDKDPATVSSKVSDRLRNISPRLASGLAVHTIISAIRKRQVVHRLYLGATSLGDAGCIRLFKFLNSPAGFHCRGSLTELFLTNNGISAQGLLAVAAFLRDNTVLRELCLSGNPLTTDPDILAEFTSALNSSRLCTLQILHCNSLGDPFVLTFLPLLTTPYLRELDLSAVSMTRASVPALIDYVKSNRCRLRRLQCNANSLTLSGARRIVRAIRESSSLQSVKLDDLHIDDDAATIAAEDKTIGWQECNQSLSALLERNSVYMARVRAESLALLRYSRALFLRLGAHGARNGARKLASASRDSRSSQSFDAPSPFFNLPVEIQQEIITYLAPSLSHRQRMRIVHFAADVTTLFPSDPQSVGVHGRMERLAETSFGKRSPLQQRQPFEGSWRPPVWWECHCEIRLQASCRCLHRWKKERRDMWLTQVACNVYEHLP